MTELNKHLITNEEFVICEICKKELGKIDGRHLRYHQIKFDEYREKFLNSPTITKQKFERELQNIEKRKKAKFEKDKETKIVNCIYFEECKNEVEVNKNVPNNSVVCKNCRDLEKVVPMSERMSSIMEVIKDKYGVENISRLKEVKDKKNATVKENMKNDPEYLVKINNKRNKSKREKFGEDFNNVINQMQKDAMKDKYGVEHALQIPRLAKIVGEKNSKIQREKYDSKLYKILKACNLRLLENYESAHDVILINCDNCNTKFRQRLYVVASGLACPNCTKRIKSKMQNELSNFVKSLGFNVTDNTRSIISPQELDIYIPSKNLAIEFNGLYFHSEEKGYDKKYHITKTENCREKGIRLIHVFEDEWIYRKDIVKNRIKHILRCSETKKINARECEIKSIDFREKNSFLEKYHLQGGLADFSGVRLGAFYNNNLVAVMTFNIIKKPGIYKLNRYCSNYNYHIPGIAGKLLKYFKNNYKWTEIITYSDLSWGRGEIYQKIGFDFSHYTGPGYCYVLNGYMGRIPRQKLRKREGEPQDIPEWLLRKNEGYIRLFDCGNFVFKLRNSNVNIEDTEIKVPDEFINTPKIKREVHKTKKKVECIYCKAILELPKNYSNKIACSDCLSRGFENPDGRTKKDAQLRRKSTLKEKYGVSNPRKIEGIEEKIKDTNNSKYGGTGFESQELKDKVVEEIQRKYGYDNFMKSDDGKNKRKGPRSEETKRKISESNKGKTSSLKNRNYDEIYGSKKGEELKEMKRKKLVNIEKAKEDFRLYGFELLDNYKNTLTKHKIKCINCGREYEKTLNKIKTRNIRCKCE